MERPVYINPSPGDLVTCLIYCTCLLKSSGLLAADRFTGVPDADWLTGVTWPVVVGVVGAWVVTAVASCESCWDGSVVVSKGPSGVIKNWDYRAGVMINLTLFLLNSSSTSKPFSTESSKHLPFLIQCYHRK